MNLTQLRYSDDLRSTTIADRYMLLLKNFAGADRLKICTWNDYFIIPKDLAHTNTLFICKQGVYSSDVVHAVHKPVISLDSMGLEVYNLSTAKATALCNYNSEIILLDFKHRLLRMFVKLFEDVLGNVYAHLRGRNISGLPLTSNAAIQNEIALCALQMATIKAVLNTAVNYKACIAELKSLANMLIKLLGGRAAMADSLIEFRWLLDVFCAVYFCDKD